MRKLLTLATVLAVSLAAAKAALAGNGTPINTGSANVLTLAVYGDSPYGKFVNDQTQIQETPAFIDSINSDPKVDLVLHLGDIHSGSDHCTAAYNNTVFGLWKSFKDPLVYTPGDNEWTDCQKAKEGGWTNTETTPWPCLSLMIAAQIRCDGYYDTTAADHKPGDPLDNLSLVRRIFFPNPGVTLGGRKKQVLSQAQSYVPDDLEYVENVMWEESKVLFVTVNIPGGSNNDGDPWYGVTPVSPRQTDEVNRRTAANIRWLNAAFAQAKKDGVQAVVIGEQADMWDLDGKDAKHLTDYTPFVQNIATNALAFAKPVLLFNGDSHVYLSDNPLADPSSDPYMGINAVYGITKSVPNFHRVVVHGSTLPLEWLKLTVNPRADFGLAAVPDAREFGPFSWERIVQP